MPTVPGTPNTLGVLRAVQALLLSNVLVGGVSPFASLGSLDAMRYGVRGQSTSVRLRISRMAICRSASSWPKATR